MFEFINYSIVVISIDKIVGLYIINVAYRKLNLLGVCNKHTIVIIVRDKKKIPLV